MDYNILYILLSGIRLYYAVDVKLLVSGIHEQAGPSSS